MAHTELCARARILNTGALCSRNPFIPRTVAGHAYQGQHPRDMFSIGYLHVAPSITDTPKVLYTYAFEPLRVLPGEYLL